MLLALQSRLAELIGANPYFTGVTPVTERRGDPAAALQENLARLNFAVLIQTASGEALEPAADRSAWRQRLVVTVAQTPVSDTQAATRNAVDGLEQVIRAVHGQPLTAGGAGPSRFRALRHEAVPVEGLNVQQVTFEIITQF